MDDKQHTDRLGQLLKEAAAERAPEGFSRSVMDRIAAVGATRAAAPALIPRWAWALIASAVAGLAVWGWLAGGDRGEGLWSEPILTGWLKPVALPAWELPALPPSLVYGTAALALFLLLHIAYLRRRLDRFWAV